ncbi:oxidoreductase, partial [Sinorhizobium meliloti]
PFRLRIPFDGERFVVFVDDEPVMQRALTDLYPDDPPLQILRVGLAVNWEWGNDTGSSLQSFIARR